MNKIKKKLILDKKINAILFEGTSMIQKDAKESILRGAKTGRTYQKYNPRRTHTASAEGQAPANDEGRLVSGISSEVTKENGQPVGIVKAFAPLKQGSGNYAVFLEFGTTQMKPRPFLHPAFEKNRKKIMTKFGNILRK